MDRDLLRPSLALKQEIGEGATAAAAAADRIERGRDSATFGLRRPRKKEERRKGKDPPSSSSSSSVVYPIYPDISLFSPFSFPLPLFQ